MSPRLSILMTVMFVCRALSSPAIVYDPNDPSCPLASNNYTSNFDDLPAPPVNINLYAGRVPVNYSVPTPYNALNYPGFFAVSGSTINVMPHSGPNAAGTNFNFASARTRGISIRYEGSTVYSFDLKSLYFGCMIIDSYNTTLPTYCTVRFTAVQANSGTRVGRSRYTFYGNGTTAGNPDMTYASFGDDFNGLCDVEIDLETTRISRPANSFTYLFTIDDVTTTIYEKL
ncbi:MAG: hypothetical protein M1816_004545 [Peltula sp. TS41687]|nr:MAG: hypothetical protein M1816_004545 [Peltula sp. TS41687]